MLTNCRIEKGAWKGACVILDKQKVHYWIKKPSMFNGSSGAGFADVDAGAAAMRVHLITSEAICVKGKQLRSAIKVSFLMQQWFDVHPKSSTRHRRMRGAVA